MIETRTIAFSTEAEMDIVDVTKDVGDLLTTAAASDGVVTVFVPGSTGAVTTMEFEPGLVRDMKELFARSLLPSRRALARQERPQSRARKPDRAVGDGSVS